MHSRHNWQSIV